MLTFSYYPNILTYTQVLLKCEDIAKHIYNNKLEFRHILAITKDSLFPATLIANYLDIKSVLPVIFNNRNKITFNPKVANNESTLVLLDNLTHDNEILLKRAIAKYPNCIYVILYAQDKFNYLRVKTLDLPTEIISNLELPWTIKDFYTLELEKENIRKQTLQSLDVIPKEELVTKVETKAKDFVVEGFQLSEEQRKAVLWIEKKRGLLTVLTGKAGTGKSTIIKSLLKRNKDWKICSTTGRSALLVGGVTVDKLFAYDRVENRCFSEECLNINLKEVKVIIVDEASMMGRNMFDYCYKECLRRKIDLILVGDWGQSPPVKDDWVFNSHWFLNDVHCISLKEVHRQTSKVFLDILNKVRQGFSDSSVSNFLTKRIDTLGLEDDSKLKIFGTNKKVDNFNETKVRNYSTKYQKQLFQLKTQVTIAEGVKVTREKVNDFRDNCGLANNELLCEGCRVLLTKNCSSAGFVNGDTGILLKNDFFFMKVLLDRTASIVIVQKLSVESKNALGKVEMTVSGFPIKPGYAFTAHKCQGLTIPKVWIDIEDIKQMHCHGLCYVALSRVKNPEDLYISSWDSKAILCDNIVKPYL